jgi:hypothetical protein
VRGEGPTVGDHRRTLHCGRSIPAVIILLELTLVSVLDIPMKKAKEAEADCEACTACATIFKRCRSGRFASSVKRLVVEIKGENAPEHVRSGSKGSPIPSMFQRHFLSAQISR